MKDVLSENTVPAHNQLRSSERVFYIGNENAGLRIAVLGNSITRHGVRPEIGWYGDYGMAASCKENDYVHILASRLKKDGFDVCMMVVQISEWEVGFSLSTMTEIQHFGANVTVFRCGENIKKNIEIMKPKAEETVRMHLTKLLSDINTKQAPIVFTSCFFRFPLVDNIIRDVCHTSGGTFVELSDLGDDPTMKAIGLFSHSGVASHPGDLGMLMIADRIYSALKTQLVIAR